MMLKMNLRRATALALGAACFFLASAARWRIPPESWCG